MALIVISVAINFMLVNNRSLLFIILELFYLEYTTEGHSNAYKYLMYCNTCKIRKKKSFLCFQIFIKSKIFWVETLKQY